MGEEARYVARYASTYVRGETFSEVGNVLAERGFDMVRATQTERGVLVVPHTRPERQAAHLFVALDAVEEAEKPDVDDMPSVLEPGASRFPPRDPEQRAAWARAQIADMASQSAIVEGLNGNGQPMNLDVASATLAGAEVESGAMEPVPLHCGECGAVHSEGVVCLIPVYRESSKCCAEHMTIYAHEQPHEAMDENGVITHRWVTKTIIEDLQFNAYGAYDPNLDGPDE